MKENCLVKRNIKRGDFILSTSAKFPGQKRYSYLVLMDPIIYQNGDPGFSALCLFEDSTVGWMYFQDRSRFDSSDYVVLPARAEV